MSMKNILNSVSPTASRLTQCHQLPQIPLPLNQRKYRARSFTCLTVKFLRAHRMEHSDSPLDSPQAGRPCRRLQRRQPCRWGQGALPVGRAVQAGQAQARRRRGEALGRRLLGRFRITCGDEGAFGMWWKFGMEQGGKAVLSQGSLA